MVALFSISTCPYCKKAIKYLRQKGIKHQTYNVDLMHPDEMDQVMYMLKPINPTLGLPCLVDSDNGVYIGSSEIRAYAYTVVANGNGNGGRKNERIG